MGTKWAGGAIVILLVGAILRLAYLDADPDYYAWAGYITDEGRWVKHARDLVLFGQATELDWAAHVHLAPLFHVAHVAVFKLLGVSLLTARLLTAISGVALLLTVWLLLRRVVSAEAVVVALALLAFDVDLVMLSRVSIPEMASLWLEMVAYYILVAVPTTPTRMAMAGFCLFVAVATKATVLPTVLIFSALVLVAGIRDSRRPSPRNLLALWGGFACVPLLASAVLLAWHQVDEPAIAGTFRVIGLFLRPASLYSVVNFPIESALAPTLNVWGMAACLVLGGWLATQSIRDDATCTRIYVTSGVWCLLYVMIMLGFSYFPDRYKIHILPPLAVNVASGLSLLQRRRSTEAPERPAEASWSRRLAAATLFGLPIAVFSAPMAASAYGLVGADSGHLRVRVLCFIAAVLITVPIVMRKMGLGGSWVPFTAFPIVATLVWLLSARTGFGEGPFWPDNGLHGIQPWWLAIGWVTPPLAWASTIALGRSPATCRVPVVSGAVLACALLAVVRILPSYVHPPYTMRETGRELEALLGGVSGTIATARAESLFNGTSLAYRIIPDHWEWRPDVLVIAFFPRFRDPEGVVDREYREVKRFELFVSPEYDDGLSGRTELARPREVVRVYQRKVSSDVRPASSGR